MGIKNKLLGMVAIGVLILGVTLSVPSGGTSIVASGAVAALIVVMIAKGALFS